MRHAGGKFLLTLATSLLCCRQAPAQRAAVPNLRTELVATIGGSRDDMARDVAWDRQGNLYVAGSTQSPDFPTTDGSVLQGPSDAFIVKLGPDGSVRWSRLIGGSGYERIYGLEVAPDGSVYAVGRAGGDFPVTPGALQTRFAGGREPGAGYGEQDGFICRLAPEDGAIRFCSWFGNEDHVPIRDIAIDAAGDLYIVSSAETGTFPAAWFAHALQPERAGGRDALLAKVRGDGTAVLWATWLGGSGNEGNTNTVRVDSTGVYVALYTRSPDMPATGFGRAKHGDSDVFVAKLSLDGSRLLWGNYVGGSGYESAETHQLAVGPDGSVFVTGPTTSRDFPVTPGAWQTRPGSAGYRRPDAFLAAIAPDGSRLLGATYLGGSRADWSEGIDVDGLGRAYVTGGTKSGDFPGLRRQRTEDDVWVAVTSARMDGLLGGALVGGTMPERGRSVALSADGRIAIGGHSASRPGTALLRQHPAPSGDDDALVVIFAPLP